MIKGLVKIGRKRKKGFFEPSYYVIKMTRIIVEFEKEELREGNIDRPLCKWFGEWKILGNLITLQCVFTNKSCVM